MLCAENWGYFKENREKWLKLRVHEINYCRELNFRHQYYENQNLASNVVFFNEMIETNPECLVKDLSRFSRF